LCVVISGELGKGVLMSICVMKFNAIKLRALIVFCAVTLGLTVPGWVHCAELRIGPVMSIQSITWAGSTEFTAIVVLTAAPIREDAYQRLGTYSSMAYAPYAAMYYMCETCKPYVGSMPTSPTITGLLPPAEKLRIINQYLFNTPEPSLGQKRQYKTTTSIGPGGFGKPNFLGSYISLPPLCSNGGCFYERRYEWPEAAEPVPPQGQSCVVTLPSGNSVSLGTVISGTRKVVGFKINSTCTLAGQILFQDRQPLPEGDVGVVTRRALATPEVRDLPATLQMKAGETTSAEIQYTIEYKGSGTSTISETVVWSPF
jgi:hypothetical protein